MNERFVMLILRLCIKTTPTFKAPYILHFYHATFNFISEYLELISSEDFDRVMRHSTRAVRYL